MAGQALYCHFLEVLHDQKKRLRQWLPLWAYKTYRTHIRELVFVQAIVCVGIITKESLIPFLKVQPYCEIICFSASVKLLIAQASVSRIVIFVIIGLQ